MSNTIEVTVYFDYRCPYSYRLVRFLTDLQAKRPNVHVAWRHFSLEQLNTPDPAWKLWEQPLDYPLREAGRFAARTLHAFLASHAASLQGEAAFARFRLALFSARHEHGADLDDPEVLMEAARQAELDLDAFRRHWQTQAARDRLRQDHLSGRALGASGTPTLLANRSRPAYVRLTGDPPPADQEAFFDELVNLLARRLYLQEFKSVSV